MGGKKREAVRFGTLGREVSTVRSRKPGELACKRGPTMFVQEGLQAKARSPFFFR
ncbi:hypothetical protein [Aneurinibacillus soli]|uniref:hypothetical protein n=1 Tax=Aneurinibacillus soli TaxID=1500254 RepID=UPI001E42AE4C|nr:hypothetical protein [Aneurinibacillus soli]